MSPRHQVAATLTVAMTPLLRMSVATGLTDVNRILIIAELRSSAIGWHSTQPAKP